MEGLPELERYLREAKILDVGAFPDPGVPKPGAHPSFRLILEGGVGALAKPEHTAPDDGAAIVRYEVAGWVVARNLGWTDLVATTVLRNTDVFPGTSGEVSTSVQVLWPGFELDADMGQFSDDDIWRAAAFDVLVRHGDRTHNWGAVPGHDRKRLRLIDHGYAFDAKRGFSSSFANQKANQDVPHEIGEQIEAFVADEGGDELGELLGDEAVEGVLDRGRNIVESGVLALP